MKELVYLDTAFLHSFLAQRFEGLPLSISTELQEYESNTQINEKNNSLNHEGNIEANSGSVSFSTIFTGPSGKGGYKLLRSKGVKQSHSLTQFEAGKEIISKQLHDNALHDFEKYLEDSNLMTDLEEDLTPGNYIKIKGKFSIISLEYLKNIFQPDSLTPILESSHRDNYESALKELAASSSLPQKIKQEIKTQENELKRLLAEQKKQIELFKNMLDYISELFPTESFIRIDKYLFPMKSEFLREKIKELSFKYGGNNEIEITAVGKFTRIYDKIPALDNESLSTLSSLTHMIEEMVEGIEIVTKGDFIVSPVAIYFE
jgi:uncharacterized protein YeeX (DUF496 family)